LSIGSKLVTTSPLELRTLHPVSLHINVCNKIFNSPSLLLSIVLSGSILRLCVSSLVISSPSVSIVSSSETSSYFLISPVQLGSGVLTSPDNALLIIFCLSFKKFFLTEGDKLFTLSLD